LLAEFSEHSGNTSWHFAYRNELPVGIAILAPGAKENEVELAFLGVMPEARGHGLSGNLLTFAMGEAARRQADSICVSVDERNWPALQLYRRHGFAEMERRGVWLAHFS
jgi:ribosomal protein S18 acetylase RimI-like enzyme